MSRVKLVRLKVDGKRLAFKRGNPPSTELSHIEAWTCPHCLKKTGKCKIIVSQVQYGFEWDTHVDYFKCKCGTYFYCSYNIWLTERETA
jgi:hypothetical protein